MRLQSVKFSIFIALLLFIASTAIAEGAKFPKTLLGKWAPTLDQCKQFPWGDDPGLIEIEGSSLIGYESNSKVSRFEEKKLNQFLLAGSVSGEGMTSDFTYKLVYLEKADSIVIRYFDEGDQVSYVRCPK
jgi:hypothetical protein